MEIMAKQFPGAFCGYSLQVLFCFTDILGLGKGFVSYPTTPFELSLLLFDVILKSDAFVQDSKLLTFWLHLQKEMTNLNISFRIMDRIVSLASLGYS